MCAGKIYLRTHWSSLHLLCLLCVGLSVSSCCSYTARGGWGLFVMTERLWWGSWQDAEWVMSLQAWERRCVNMLSSSREAEHNLSYKQVATFSLLLLTYIFLERRFKRQEEPSKPSRQTSCRMQAKGFHPRISVWANPLKTDQILP